MATLSNGIDHLANLVSGKESKLGFDQSGLKSAIAICYFTFTFVWLLVLSEFSDSDFSLVMTGGATLQCLGFVILCLRVRATKSVEGLSSNMLSMFAIYYCVRLASTSIKNGYIPVDASGDFMYQAMDAAALVAVLYLLYAVHKLYSHSYQEEDDSLPIKPLVIPSLVLAYFVHGDFNKCEFFDIVWTFSLNLETLAMLPQLWMMAKVGGKVDTTMAHFVACIVFSCVCRFEFWWYAAPELAEEEGSSWYAMVHVLGAHILQLVFSADFMFYYAQAWINGTSVLLPDAEGIEI